MSICCLPAGSSPRTAAGTNHSRCCCPAEELCSWSSSRCATWRREASPCAPATPPAGSWTPPDTSTHKLQLWIHCIYGTDVMWNSLSQQPADVLVVRQLQRVHDEDAGPAEDQLIRLVKAEYQFIIDPCRLTSLTLCPSASPAECTPVNTNSLSTLRQHDTTYQQL